MPVTGSDLSFLAAVSELSKVDLEAGSIGLIAEDGRITARYRGTYSMGERFLDYEGPALRCEVNAQRFKGLAALFADQQRVKLALKGDTLHLSSTGDKGRAVSLQIQRAEVEPPGELDSADADTSVKINADELAKEFELATDFTAKNAATIVLQSLNLVVSGKRVRLTAMDGISGIYTTAIETLNPKKVSVEMVNVSTLDFGLGLKVIGGGEAKLEVICQPDPDSHEATPTRIRIEGAMSRFATAVLPNEDWPDISEVTEFDDYELTVTVRGDVLRDAVSGVKELSPNYAKSGIEIATDNEEHLLLRALDTEHGQFVAKAGRAASTVEGLTYSVSSMEKAAKLGDILQIDVPSDKRKQTRVRAGNRQLWISATAN